MTDFHRCRSIAVPGMVAVLLALVGGPALAEEDAEPAVETLVAVSVTPVKRTTLSAHLTAYGRIDTALASTTQAAAGARLTLPSSGPIVTVPVREGQTVAKGALLVSLDTHAAEAAVVAAKAAVEQASEASERQRKLLKLQATSDKLDQEASLQLETARRELAAAQLALAQLKLVAPFAGIVGKLRARPGEIADPAQPLVELFEPARLIVTAGVPADQADAVQPGRPVNVYAATGQAGIEARVLDVAPVVDERDGTVAVRASLPAKTTLRPGQFVRLEIATEEHANVLAVPVESVVKDEALGPVVAIVEGEQATQKPVKLGLRDGDWQEVEGEGIAAGSTVVTAGAYGLPHQTRVRIVKPGN